MAEFDARKDVRIQAHAVGDDLLCLRTHGLSKRFRPELEVYGVGPEQVHHASPLLNLVGDYSVRQEPIEDQETVGVDLGSLALTVRAVALGEGPERRLRLVDLWHKAAVDEPPRCALSSVMYVRAQQALEAGDADAASALWREAVAFFPGDPARRAHRYPPGLVVNSENHLAYLALAETQDAAEVYYRAALARCLALEAYELGAPTLPWVETKKLLADFERIIDSVQGTRLPQGPAPGPALLLSPIWTPGGGETAVRALCLLPPEFGSYVHQGPTAEKLRRDPALRELAAAAYQRLYKQPHELLVLTRQVRNLYDEPPSPGQIHLAAHADGRAPRQDVAHPYAPHLKALSGLSALLGRLLAAGLTVPEMQAWLGLTVKEAARRSAEEKLDAQSAREEVWFKSVAAS